MELGSRGYPIVITRDDWGSLGGRIKQKLPDLTHALVVCDAAVRPRWGDGLCEGLRSAGVGRCDTFEVPSGEPSKSIEMLGRLWDWMLASNADRRGVVIAIGGGVVGDLAGFAAASFARGVRLVQVPTTLLSMVDSSVGGKTGINLEGGKNMVGAFWQPSLVLIDTATLGTLGQRDYRGGLAEVIKYGVIEDAAFFEWLERHVERLDAREHEVVAEAIRHCCRIKAAVVADDERETSGRRAILNYGHTFGHAIEATAGYGTFTHGEAVAIGMSMAARLARSLGRVDDAFVVRQDALIIGCGLPTRWEGADPSEMIPVMRKDKKVAHAALRLILPTRLGHVELVPCEDIDRITRAIEACR